MNKKEFEELLARGRENLSIEERTKVAQFILDNEKERDICINGALASGDMRLALALMFGKAELTS